MSAPIASRHRGSCPGTCFQTAVSFSLVHMYGCAEDSADQSAIACDRRCARLRSSRSLTRGLRNCGGRPRHPRQGGCLQDAARAADLERSAFAQGAAFGVGFLDPKGRCARSRLPPPRASRHGGDHASARPRPRHVVRAMPPPRAARRARCPRMPPKHRTAKLRPSHAMNFPAFPDILAPRKKGLKPACPEGLARKDWPFFCHDPG